MENNIIIKNDNKIELYKQGKEIINKNNFFKDLSNIMENKEFNDFFKKYLNSWIDVRCIIIYMKLYSEFKEQYKSINNNEELDKEIIVFLLKKIMNDKDLRTFSIKTIEKKYDEKKIDFFKELKRVLKKKNLLVDF